ncbi:hypothetical protein GJ496_011496 [Pomphorhynchus laevis]|nr:hypothetical protein GJ496_011496 [Pomphorhynchus laevis]
MTAHASIIRTTFESGLKRIDKDYPEGKSAADIISIVQKNDEKQRLELIELNRKLSNYVNHVKKLEEQNRYLELELKKLKEDALTGIRSVSECSDRERIESLRRLLNNEAQARAEILSKSHWSNERILDQLHDQIQFEESLEKMLSDRFRNLSEINENVLSNLAEIKQALGNMGLSQNSYDPSSSSYLQQLIDQYEKLRDNYTDKLYEKAVAEELLRSAEEKLSFIRALSEQEYAELDRFRSANVDARTFYRNELMGSIVGIRRDFEDLKHKSLKEFEQYYTAKTEIIRRQINQEKEKDILRITDQEVRQTHIVNSMNTELNELKSEMNPLIRDIEKLNNEAYATEQRYRETHLNNNKILTDQQYEINRLQQIVDQIENQMTCMSDFNVNLNFEIHTYRRLIESEEMHNESNDKFNEMLDKSEGYNQRRYVNQRITGSGQDDLTYETRYKTSYGGTREDILEDKHQKQYENTFSSNSEIKESTERHIPMGIGGDKDEEDEQQDDKDSKWVYKMSFNVRLPGSKAGSLSEENQPKVRIDSISNDGSVLVLVARKDDQNDVVDISEWCVSQSYRGQMSGGSDNAVLYYYLPEQFLMPQTGELKIFSNQAKDIATDFPVGEAVVAENVESWLSGSAISTKLVDNDGEQIHEI